MSPRTAPSKGAKLCTYWFGGPINLRFEPYYELPMGISKLRTLVQFRLGSHTLPIEQGRFARPALPRRLRRCTFCSTQAVGDEVHSVFDCPHSSDIRAQFPGLFQHAAGCMRMVMSYKPGWLNGRSESLSLSLSCGTRTRSLSAIVSLPCCRRLRHEYNPVLISQAG